MVFSGQRKEGKARRVRGKPCVAFRIKEPNDGDTVTKARFGWSKLESLLT